MGEDSLHVGEMFAGVGGFRLGLEGPPSKDWETEFLKFEETGFKVVWSNQWEPPPPKPKVKSTSYRPTCLEHPPKSSQMEGKGIT